MAEKARLARRRWAWSAPLGVWAALIFIASSIPNPPDAGGGDWKYELAHVFEYAVFAALASGAARSWLPRAGAPVIFTFAWVIAVLYGVSDELHQAFVPNRDSSAPDVGFDAVGAAIGATVAWLSTKRGRPLRGGLP